MNLAYNRWRERCLFECLDSEEFECVHCSCVVKHPIYHYIKYHKYVRQLPLTRLKRWIRNSYITLYNKWFDSITHKRVQKIKKDVNTVIDTRIKTVSPRYKKESAWQELLRLEREVLVCQQMERCHYD